MFGVFSAYEQQVLRDWIVSAPQGAETAAGGAPRVLTHRARQRTLDNLGQHADRSGHYPVRGLLRRRAATEENEAGNELHLLEQRIASLAGKQEAMTMLAGLMSPSTHHTAAGLMATRMYSQLLDT
jgi:hypothetical protein